jgi:putative transposase
MKRDVKLIYTAVSADAARAALDELAEKSGKQYGAVIRLWKSAWSSSPRSWTTTPRSAQ